MMKEVIALLLALTMIAALFVGCAKNDEKPSEDNKPSESTPASSDDNNEPASRRFTRQNFSLVLQGGSFLL